MEMLSRENLFVLIVTDYADLSDSLRRWGVPTIAYKEPAMGDLREAALEKATRSIAPVRGIMTTVLRFGVGDKGYRFLVCAEELDRLCGLLWIVANDLEKLTIEISLLITETGRKRFANNFQTQKLILEPFKHINAIATLHMLIHANMDGHLTEDFIFDFGLAWAEETPRTAEDVIYYISSIVADGDEASEQNDYMRMIRQYLKGFRLFQLLLQYPDQGVKLKGGSFNGWRFHDAGKYLSFQLWCRRALVLRKVCRWHEILEVVEYPIKWYPAIGNAADAAMAYYLKAIALLSRFKPALYNFRIAQTLQPNDADIEREYVRTRSYVPPDREEVIVRHPNLLRHRWYRIERTWTWA